MKQLKIIAKNNIRGDSENKIYIRAACAIQANERFQNIGGNV